MKIETYFEMQKQRIVAEERNRLARDLHDGIKQQFYALGAQIQIINELYLQPNRVQTHLQAAMLLLQNIQEEIDGLIHHLRPAALAKKELKHALQDYIQFWSQLSSIHTIFVYDLQNNKEQDLIPLEPEQEEALFRVAQEALSNIARHSGARHAEVCLSRNNQETILSIGDNGYGFDLERVEPGVGLQSMQERLHMLGGTVEITSAPGQGTGVVTSLKHVASPSLYSLILKSPVLVHTTGR
jgi:two-component system, NarL family, sensor histidine kinase LiaS